ncbi:tetratricopeptide repeat protein [cf. Phormidesmis sp. LEGE 11477]|uniref:tetratricopeptide repeat protein n=1 Tax=cf. Phormidesmis sp. LEGE 11477 TaxID=1828680 RepID=UPI00351CCB0C
MGQFPLALSDLNQAIALAPDNADAHYNRGKVHLELGDAEAALTDFDTAIALSPDLAEAYGNRGLLRYQLSDARTAIEDLQQAADLFQVRGDRQSYEQTMQFIQQIQLGTAMERQS